MSVCKQFGLNPVFIFGEIDMYAGGVECWKKLWNQACAASHRSDGTDRRNSSDVRTFYGDFSVNVI